MDDSSHPDAWKDAKFMPKVDHRFCLAPMDTPQQSGALRAAVSHKALSFLTTVIQQSEAMDMWGLLASEAATDFGYSAKSAEPIGCQ